MLVLLFRVRFALLAAKALEVNSSANPTTKLFDTLVNFIACSLSFLARSRSGGLGAAPVHELRGENTCVSPRIAYNAAAGVERQAPCLRFRFGGFLTWAAKPSVRESPNPAFRFLVSAGSPLPAFYPLHAITDWLWNLFPAKNHFVLLSFGRFAYRSGSKNFGLIRFSERAHAQNVL
jgi:hypothetical protein